MPEFPSFLRLNNILSYVCTTFCSFVAGFLGSFHLLVAVNDPAMNMGVLRSLRDPSFNSFGELK